MDNNTLQPEHERPEFEREDWTPKAVYAFLAGLGLMCVLAYFIIWGVFGYLDAYSRNHEPAQNPLVTAASADTRKVTPAEVTGFPQPRLETDERTEIYTFRLEEEQKLHSYGWVDQNAGVMRIPINRAMDLIAQRGLPTQPKVGATPASPVNMARKAAGESGKTKKK